MTSDAVSADGDGIEGMARAFVDARRRGRALADYPGPRPSSMRQAYAIQERAIRLWTGPIVGWKVAAIGGHAVDRSVGRLIGPIFADRLWRSGAGPVAVPLIADGFAAVEAEYVLMIGRTARPRSDWTVEDVEPLVEKVFAAMEIAGSAYPEINRHGPEVTASDFGNNMGLIVGPEILDWKRTLASDRCTMRIDGVVVGCGGVDAVPGGLLESLSSMLNLLGDRDRTLFEGDYVSTGATTGVHPILAGQMAVADFGGHGVVSCIMRPFDESF